MKGVPARGVWVLLAALLVVFAAIALYAVRSIEGTRASLRENADDAAEAGAAVSEMKRGVAVVGRGTADYVRTDEPEHREAVEEGREAFEGVWARYEGLVAGEADGGIRALYEEYEAASEGLLRANDEGEAARGRAERELSEVRRLLGDGTRETVEARGPDSARKLGEATGMSGAVAGVEGELAGRARENLDLDTLIAAQAVALGLTLITNNVGEFSRVPNFKVEDWTGA